MFKTVYNYCEKKYKLDLEKTFKVYLIWMF